MILDIKLIQKSVKRESQKYSQYFVRCQILFSKLCFTISNIYHLQNIVLLDFLVLIITNFLIYLCIVSIIVRDSPEKNVKNDRNLVYNRKSTYAPLKSKSRPSDYCNCIQKNLKTLILKFRSAIQITKEELYLVKKKFMNYFDSYTNNRLK